MIKKEKKWPTCKGESSFSYSDQELHFRKDVDVIQQIKPLTWSGCFVPEGSDIYSYNEIEQGSGLCGNAIRPIGTMSSYNLYPIEHFNNYYKK
jgi:hypothetical protein